MIAGTYRKLPAIVTTLVLASGGAIFMPTGGYAGEPVDPQIESCAGGSCAAADAVAQAQGLGVGNAQAIGGAASSELINSTVAVSNQSIVNRISMVNEDSIAPPPTGMWRDVPIPQIFSAPTIPNSAKGIPLSLAYFNECGANVADYHPREHQGRGASRNTEIVFLPHRNLEAKATEGAVVDTVKVMFPDTAENVDCLGIINVMAREKRADRVHLFGLFNDGQRYLKENISGFEHVGMLCAENSIGANIGIKSRGIGAAISPGYSDPGSSGILATILGGLSGQSAKTFPDAQLGITCLVISEDGESSIDISYLNGGLHPLGLNGGKTGKDAYGSAEQDPTMHNGNGNGN